MEGFEGVLPNQMLSIGMRSPSPLGQQALLLPVSGDLPRNDAPQDLGCRQPVEWGQTSNPKAVLERGFGHESHFCAQ